MAAVRCPRGSVLIHVGGFALSCRQHSPLASFVTPVVTETWAAAEQTGLAVCIVLLVDLWKLTPVRESAL